MCRNSICPSGGGHSGPQSCCVSAPLVFLLSGRRVRPRADLWGHGLAMSASLPVWGNPAGFVFRGVVYHLTLRAGFLGHPCHRQVVSGCRRELTVLLETAHRRPAERNLFIFPFLLKHTQVSRVRSGPLLWQVTSSSWAQRGCRRPVPAPGLPRTCRESPPALTAVRVLPGLSRGSCCSALFFSAVRQRPQGSGLRRKTPVLPAGPVSPCAGPSPASGWGRGY